MGITSILSLLSGVALFLFGMSLMGDGLKKAAGEKLELILYKLTNTPIKGVLLGTAVTAIIQSSSATTVMVVGFVNSGMMKVSQAIGIIMGANIGTSITGWILCLSYIEGSSGIAQLLSTTTISAVVSIIGILFKMISKKSTYKNIGDIMLGYAEHERRGVSTKGKSPFCQYVNNVFQSFYGDFGRYCIHSSVAERFRIYWYFAGVICDRSDYVCICISNNARYWCWRCMSSFVVLNWNQQKRQENCVNLSDE